MFIPIWSAGKSAALDATITCPLKPSLISDAARSSDFALTNADKWRYEQYDDKISEIDNQFIPLAFESFMGFSELIQKSLKRIA